jgi:hypothetical protein
MSAFKGYIVFVNGIGVELEDVVVTHFINDEPKESVRVESLPPGSSTPVREITLVRDTNDSWRVQFKARLPGKFDDKKRNWSTYRKGPRGVEVMLPNGDPVFNVEANFREQDEGAALIMQLVRRKDLEGLGLPFKNVIDFHFPVTDHKLVPPLRPVTDFEVGILD